MLSSHVSSCLGSGLVEDPWDFVVAPHRTLSPAGFVLPRPRVCFNLQPNCMKFTGVQLASCKSHFDLGVSRCSFVLGAHVGA